jgi:hypothetical protein
MRLSRSPIVLSLPLLACASRQPVPTRYVRAEPEQEPVRRPAVIQVPTPLPLPGQLERVPTSARHRRVEKPPTSEVIAEANRKASAGPDREGYFNAIMTYDFADGALFQVYAAPLRLTAIQLQPGEKILGKPAAGDTIRWIMGVGRSGTDAAEQQHLYIKPTRSGLATTMAINTDRRMRRIVNGQMTLEVFLGAVLEHLGELVAFGRALRVLRIPPRELSGRTRASNSRRSVVRRAARG